ncbi:hypothetical protein [Raineyella sp. LH-20]|uniref:hypothetical protein n=1 Tax=Raineyella sp. LH-20 TaxID=3081204 RepID=UPI0029559489|nr:hypothetical protein [Raineyella sp. LH-20]WOP17398.1 hypothetical protein R0146_08895 [Raineyella sp. LH-20]
MTDGVEVESEKSNASKLFERLARWRQTPAGVTVVNHRDEEGVGWWQAHVEAMTWLDEVQRQLEVLKVQGRPVEYLDPGLEAARRAILCTDWVMRETPSAPREHLTASDLGMLAGAVGMVDVAGVPIEDAAALQSLLPYVDEARALISGLDLDADARDYLLELVNRLDQALRGVGVHGEPDVRRWAAELIGALGIYASSGDEAQDDRTRGFIVRFGSTVKAFLLHEIPRAILASAMDGVVQGALPPGN